MLGKIFEKILFNSIFEYLQENTLLCANQSGFRLSDLCEFQLLPIVHEIHASFDCHSLKGVRGFFLDISKAFERVRHEELIYKMQCLSVKVKFLKLLQGFLYNRHQMVSLQHGTSISWCTSYITRETFLLKNHTQMWRRNYSQTIFQKFEIEHISESIV